MTTVLSATDIDRMIEEFAPIAGAHRRTLETIFHHPAAHNVKWTDIIGLIGEIGAVHSQAHDKFVFEVAGKRKMFHKPHSKDLTSTEVEDIRHFLMPGGSSPLAAAHPDPRTPNLLIVIDHHGARIFQVELATADSPEHTIQPHDPRHLLHHFVHKDEAREQGQPTPNDAAFHEKIAGSAALGGRIVILGHGAGKSNAAHRLADYLLKHHPEIHHRIVRQIDADLSSITDPQLLVLARETLRA